MKIYKKPITHSIIFISLLCGYVSGYAQTSLPVTLVKTYDRFKNLKTYESALEEKNALAGPLQKLGVQRSFVGDVVGAEDAFDLRLKLIGKKPDTYKQDNLRIEDAVAEDAIAAIVKEAKNRQVVILNEAHHVPLHRAFAMKLARELRKIGYEYLACETFGEPIDKAYFTHSNGYYSREPVFANFLRDAQKDHWNFVQYEPMDLDSNLPNDQYMRLREIGQANNLIQKIFKKNPNAKAFVYVGYWHVTKLPLDKKNTDFGWMAEQQKIQANIDPLSIDQTILTNHSSLEAEYPAYRTALKKDKTGNSFVLKSSKNEYQVFGDYKDRVDMQIVHPAYGINAQHHRADWLVSVAGFIPHDIPKNILPVTGRRLIYAYELNAAEDAVPVDAIVVEAGKPIPKLMLPAGQYQFSYED